MSEDFTSIIDILTRKMAVFKGDNGETIEWVEVPHEYKDKLEELHAKIVLAACDLDDVLAEKYLMEQEITLAEIKAALRKGVVELKVVPVFCGSAFKNKGVQLLLDGVIDYLPSPIDVPAIEGTNTDTGEKFPITSDPNGPFYALVFKIMADPFVGVLNFVRVYSGELKAGSYVYSVRTGEKERVSRLLKMHANKREEITSVRAGDIAAVVGIKDAQTGDTLCIDKAPVVLESITIPTPVISTSVEPKSKADYEKMTLALRKIMQEDPSFRFSYNEETGQTVISGMGELHLEIIVDRLRREHKVEVVQGKLQVAYRETIQKLADAEGKFVRQSGGRGQFEHLGIKMEPLERGKGFEFVNGVVGGTIPKEFIPAVEKGVRETLTAGILGGYPVVDVKVTLYDGSYHDVDSSEIAFKVAAAMAFRTAMTKGSPVLLEPIMKVNVYTPDEHIGDCIGDLNSRRGRIIYSRTEFNQQIISAEVALGEMFGYSTMLRSMTKGRASYDMEFLCYREVPKNVQDAIVAKNKKE